MEEFVGPTIWKGSGRSPGIYQRECVIRTIPQAELEALMRDIFQDAQKAEPVALWTDMGILEAALEEGKAEGREARYSLPVLRGATCRSEQHSRGSFSTVRCSKSLATPPRMYLELECLGQNPNSATY